MNEPRAQSEWLRPPTAISIIVSMGAVVSFWVSFNQRVSDNTRDIDAERRIMAEHKIDENERLKRMEDKIDRILERGQTQPRNGQ